MVPALAKEGLEPKRRVAPVLPPAMAVAVFRTIVLSAAMTPAKRLVPPRMSLPEPVWTMEPAPVRPPVKLMSFEPPAMVRVARLSTTLTTLVSVPVAVPANCRVAAVTPVGRFKFTPAPRAVSLPRVTMPPRRSVSPA